MCGITGVLNLTQKSPIARSTMQSMIDALYHRGPDECGMYLDDWVGLGNARLSIIDVEGGTQPIHDEKRDLWIVYNGEIFNYPELRSKLLSRGHRFYTTTDTEVILHLYQEFGPDCLAQLNGQFAFAIWNTRTRELFLARDRVGINPLFYSVSDGRLVLASEIKSILSSGFIKPNIDLKTLKQILTFWTPLPGRTIFNSVRELPPGHFMRVKNGTLEVKHYWQPPLVPKENQVIWSTDQITERVEELLLDAIRIRLRADVSVGAYLSGGLDSSGIVSMIASEFNNELKTFGIRFDEHDFDEGSQQQEVAKYLGLAHGERQISNQSIADAFVDVIYHTETPVMRTAPAPMFLLSQFVNSNDLKVVLTGEGADEIFGGYNIFRENKVRRFWATQPQSRYRYLLLRKLYPYIFRDEQSKRALQLFFRRNLTQTDDPAYSHRIRWTNSGKNSYYLSKDINAMIGDYNPEDDLETLIPDGFSQADAFTRAQFFEMTLFMSEYLLSSQGERMAMAHSVELRVPYLDHRIIEFMARVPAKYKIRGMNEKYLLKKVFDPRLPHSIVHREKNPFRAPISQSFRNGKSNHYLVPKQIESTGIFDSEKVHTLLEKANSGASLSETDNMALTTVLSTQIIDQMFVQDFENRSAGYKTEPTIFDHRSAIQSETEIN